MLDISSIVLKHPFILKNDQKNICKSYIVNGENNLFTVDTPVLSVSNIIDDMIELNGSINDGFYDFVKKLNEKLIEQLSANSVSWYKRHYSIRQLSNIFGNIVVKKDSDTYTLFTHISEELKSELEIGDNIKCTVKFESLNTHAKGFNLMTQLVDYVRDIVIDFSKIEQVEEINKVDEQVEDSVDNKACDDKACDKACDQIDDKACDKIDDKACDKIEEQVHDKEDEIKKVDEQVHDETEECETKTIILKEHVPVHETKKSKKSKIEELELKLEEALEIGDIDLAHKVTKLIKYYNSKQ